MSALVLHMNIFFHLFASHSIGWARFLVLFSIVLFFFTIFLHNVLRPALLTGFRILFVLFNLLRRRKTDRPVDRIATSKRGVYVHTYIYNVSQPRSRLHYNLKLIASHSTVDLENENRWMWVFLHVYPALGHCLALFLLLFVRFQLLLSCQTDSNAI